MTHTAYIETEAGTHYAVCSCGWRSRPRSYLGRTEDDAEDHERGCVLECARCGEDHEFECAGDEA